MYYLQEIFPKLSIILKILNLDKLLLKKYKKELNVNYIVVIINKHYLI